MNKKTIILCVSLIGVFVIIVAVALSFLYSGTGESGDSLADDRESMLFSAVPSDASMVLKFQEFGRMLDAVAADESPVRSFVMDRTDSGKMAAFLAGTLSSSSLYSSLMSSPAVLSLHNIGKLTPLLIIDAGKASDEPSASVSAMISAATEAGMTASYEDVSGYLPAGNPLRKRSLLLISPSDILVQSSLRHLKAKVSVLDVEGLPEAVVKASSEDLLVLPHSGLDGIAEEVLSPSGRKSSSFIGRFADCIAFSVENMSAGEFSMKGRPVAGNGRNCFLDLYMNVGSSSPQVSSVLPSYTVAAASVPVDNAAAYASAYMDFSETMSLVRDVEGRRSSLQKKTGIDPVDWAGAINLKEVSAASFVTGGKLEKILLVRMEKLNFPLLFKGIGDVTKDSCERRIFRYGYGGYLSLLFGGMFSLEDESCFLVDGEWMIIGSRTALAEYAGGRAREYTLAEYLSDAGVGNPMSGRNVYFTSYLSLSEDRAFNKSLFSGNFLPAVDKSLEGISYEPLFLTVSEDKAGILVDVSSCRTVVTRSKAPTFERDTEVVVPEGPFRVKNSGTSRWNRFYQQDNLYLCLQEEDGKGIWGVEFNAPICGRAETVDYFANGKLQILFAAGSKLYLIDRLGRFVNPFPIELGKPVLIGPDVYDFSGKRKYNVMILHTDNTIEMYNLQGRRPPQWKTITSDETIKGLPERIRVNGSTYWVVRTSIQTLIFGFYGGEPLTRFEGDRMIRPDSEVVPGKDGTVEVVCYDGRKHQVKIAGK